MQDKHGILIFIRCGILILANIVDISIVKESKNKFKWVVDKQQSSNFHLLYISY